jgi:hypothetical protein
VHGRHSTGRNLVVEHVSAHDPCAFRVSTMGYQTHLT